jgi:heptosyltransferase III
MAGTGRNSTLKPRNLLIFRIGHLGDTVIALPALWAIRRQFPMARLTLLTNIDLKNDHYVSPADVLPREGLIDDFIAYPTNLGRLQSSAAKVDLAVKLRKGRFDAVIYLMPRVRTEKQIRRDTAFFRLAGIRKIWGSEFFLEHRLDLPVPRPAPVVESESDFLLRLLEHCGIESANKETDLLLMAGEVDTADRWFARSVPAATHGGYIAICPGGKYPWKMWDERKYHDVIARLIDRFRLYPIVFGGSEEREMGDRLIGSWATGANTAGELSIRESAALLRRCKLYLGNDTGTMHLAAATGIPCVALFSGSDWVGRWSPFGNANRLFRHEGECRECIAQDQDNQHTCLDMIGVDEVFAACSEIMKA